MFIDVHVAVQPSHHLLKRLCLLHCIFVPPLSEINWPQVCRSDWCFALAHHVFSDSHCLCCCRTTDAVAQTTRSVSQRIDLGARHKAPARVKSLMTLGNNCFWAILTPSFALQIPSWPLPQINRGASFPQHRVEEYQEPKRSLGPNASKKEWWPVIVWCLGVLSWDLRPCPLLEVNRLADTEWPSVLPSKHRVQCGKVNTPRE